MDLDDMMKSMGIRMNNKIPLEDMVKNRGVDYKEDCAESKHVECHHCGFPEGCDHPLKRCSGCQLVTYCSKDCQEDDWKAHKHICKKFPLVNGKNVYCTKGPWEKHIAGLMEQAAQLPKPHNITARRVFMNPKVCMTCHESKPHNFKPCKCTLAYYCSFKCSRKDKLHMHNCDFYSKMMLESAKECMRISYPASFWNFLEQIMKAGFNRRSIMESGIMDIHVVTNTAYIDAVAFESLFHKIPNLELIEIDFILQDVPYDASLDRYKVQLPKLGCKECDSRERIIRYSVYQKPYHMYFSSAPAYLKPDFVIVYGIPHQKDDIHKEISYRNMLNYTGSVIVLMDSSKDKVIQAVEDVKAAQPTSVVLLPPKRNTARGFGAFADAPNVEHHVWNAYAPNVKHYMAGLHRPSGERAEQQYPHLEEGEARVISTTIGDTTVFDVIPKDLMIMT